MTAPDQRRAVVMNWMWEVVLPEGQPLADENGFGSEWRKMCKERTTYPAFAASCAAFDHYWKSGSYLTRNMAMAAHRAGCATLSDNATAITHALGAAHNVSMVVATEFWDRVNIASLFDQTSGANH